HMSRSDGYSLTHALMYATDFGRTAVVDIDRDRVAATIDASIAWCIGSEDLDLLCELVIAASTLRIPWSLYVCAAWSVMQKVFSELGFLPSPNFDVDEYGRLAQKARTTYIFDHIYHTHYVLGILCAILLVLFANFGLVVKMNATGVQEIERAVEQKLSHVLRCAMSFANDASLQARAFARRVIDGTRALDLVRLQLERAPGTLGRPAALWRSVLSAGNLGEAQR